MPMPTSVAQTSPMRHLTRCVPATDTIWRPVGWSPDSVEPSVRRWSLDTADHDDRQHSDCVFEFQTQLLAQRGKITTGQLSVGTRSMLSTMIVSIGRRRGSNFRPSCSTDFTADVPDG